ncbi:nucleoside hydrolase [Cohnella thailandensis]|uniref:Nucleoside hydrolase n=1 Tax=Cohnella thailandensis TaxID=557557 RepID=A0A841SYL4_9BACL|nr:nucleoside hydrolase [Cohnella thailandensis]MBB6636352.1 nucleoside hydrolase [Cohnella thailandensis]MBP1973678.1 purine nucleosidase [Cohnella thailandensis]
MNFQKRLIIDTDTAGDDVTSILFGLLWPGVKVEAITTVMGNIPVGQCTINALTTVEHAGRSGEVPVFEGCDRPLLRPLVQAAYVHGADGMGETNFPLPRQKAETEHAANAIVRLLNEYPGELEIVAHGPLTNLAVAYMLDPSIVHKVKKVWVMGGSCHFRGNITSTAEFNFYVDPEAAQMVFQAGFPIAMVGWDVCVRYALVGGEDLEKLKRIDTEVSRFYHQVNRKALEFNLANGLEGVTHPDSVTIAMCIRPELILKSGHYPVEIECHSEANRGFSAVDTRPAPENTPAWSGERPRSEVVLESDYREFYRMLTAMLSGDFSEFAAP